MRDRGSRAHRPLAAPAGIASGSAMRDKFVTDHPAPDAMPAFICETCGTQFTPVRAAAAGMPDLRRTSGSSCRPPGRDGPRSTRSKRRHFNCYREHEPGLIGIGTDPAVRHRPARAAASRTPHGNILWDCIALIDAATIEIVKALGGLTGHRDLAPALLHARMVEWSRAFGGVPIHLHAADRQWIMRPDPAIKLWDGDTLAARERARRSFAAAGITPVAPCCTGPQRRGRRAARCCRATSSRSIPDRKLCQLHAQLSQSRSAVGAGGGTHRRPCWSHSPVRCDLRRVGSIATFCTTARMR